MAKKGDVVTIYAKPGQREGMVGDAKLIELVDPGGNQAKYEKWLVQIIGETKLETWRIPKEEQAQERPPPKMEAYEKDGIIKYRYKKSREEMEERYKDSYQEFIKNRKGKNNG